MYYSYPITTLIPRIIHSAAISGIPITQCIVIISREPAHKAAKPVQNGKQCLYTQKHDGYAKSF